MKNMTGVYLTDSVSISGVSFTVEALEDALWQGYRQCVPSNISHDIHRPLGVTNISSLLLSHEMAYLLGSTSIPETEMEMKSVMTARTSFLNEKMIERVTKYSQDFNLEIQKLGLLKEGGMLMSNGVVMYGYENIVHKAFPFLKDIMDGDGLIYIRDLLKDFDYKGDGVFSSKRNNLSVMVHPYLRRSFSRYNCYNKGFLQELFKANTDESPVRIRIDLDFVGYTPSYIETQEFDYWFGPSYSDDISKIEEGVTAYTTNDTEKIFNQIKKTEFVWQDKDGKRQFEMEEVTDADAPTLEEGTFGCRYIHSFYDPVTGLFDHFDGAVRCYDLDQICVRLEIPINKAGHHAQYTKLFRIDGRVPISKWKSLITHYLKGNEDVYRYFGVSTPFVQKNHEEVSPIAKYVPFVVKPGDGVRILFSYHSLQKQDIERYFTDFDTCYLREGNIETTDLMSVDLTKCIRRSGGVIEYPSCKYISYRDNYHDIPEIYHGGTEPCKALKTTLDGIKMFLDGLKGRGVKDCLSFCLSWDLEDRKAKISVMGAVPDLLDWFISVDDLPVDREGIRKWLSQQAANLKKQGKDTPSPIYGSYIHTNGIFYHHRRLLQRDAELKELFYDNSKGLCVSMEFAEEDAEVKSLYEGGHIYPVPYVVVGKLLCKDNKDYLQCEEISCLGETECDTTISFMTLVWASDQNGLTSLIQ